jgi:hypothetical protein
LGRQFENRLVPGDGAAEVAHVDPHMFQPRRIHRFDHTTDRYRHPARSLTHGSGDPEHWPTAAVLLLDELPEFSRSVLESYGSLVGETESFRRNSNERE